VTGQAQKLILHNILDMDVAMQEDKLKIAVITVQ
jgi:hypothetical protein